MPDKLDEGERHTRRLWPILAAPGVFWLIALFLVPFYAVMAVAFSGVIDIYGEPIPAWNPLDWQFATFQDVLTDSISGAFQAVWLRTFYYCFWALIICVVDRIPGRVLHRPVGREASWSHPGSHPGAVVDQLHHPDAGLDQPLARRRVRQRLPGIVRDRARSNGCRATRSRS